MVQPIARQSMQQIASTTTEPAASNLPFSLRQNVGGQNAGGQSLANNALNILGGQNEARQSFNTELLRQLKPIRSFEQPRQPTMPVSDSLRDNRNNGNSRAEQHSTQNRSSNNEPARAREPNDSTQRNEPHNNIRNNARDDARNNDRNDNIQRKTTNSTAENSFERRSAQQRQEHLQDRLESTKKESAFTANKTPDANVSENTQAVNANTAVDKANESSLPNSKQSKVDDALPLANKNASQHSAAENAAALSEDGAKPESFDYIDYVTALAEFTSKELSAKETSSEELAQKTLLTSPNANMTEAELDALKAQVQENLLTNGDETSLAEKQAAMRELILSNKVGTGDESEKIALTISEEDLQALFDARQNGQGDNRAMSLQDRAQIDKITGDLAAQLKTNSDADTNESDKALLQALLSTGTDKTTDVAGAVNSNIEQNQQDKKGVLLAEVPTNAKIGSSSTSAPTILENQVIIGNNAVSGQILVGEQSGLNSQILANPAHEKLLANDLATPSPAISKDLIDIKKPETASLALSTLAELSEPQTKAALENLSQRVQSIASQMSGESKGNEFIAALQSGLKDFKQQLAQGREPGIDLKALVSEAIAQISGETTKSQQPKIDAAVNQFNAALQLSSALNSSASQLQAHNLGLTDGQLTKEINLTQVEGTKLANSLTNQMAAQASADKAVNIFKQEGQQQLAEKVRWMVNARTATAEIRLDPADLGGINIKINISGDTAQVNFNVQSAAAKEALDQAAPRLREMLQDQGIELGQSSVQQDSQSSQQEQGQDEPGTMSQGLNTVATADKAQEHDTPAPHMVEQRISNGAIGGIDYYA